MSPVRRLASSLALAAVAAVFMSGTAVAASPGLVISQVYGGGGNLGAPLLHDYVELFNRSTVDLPLSGLSLQYASAAGTGVFGANDGAITPLSGTLAAGHYVLVREAAGTGTQPGIDADITDATPIAMAAGAGKVALVSSATSLGCNGGPTVCDSTQLAQIIDLVGYGTGANGANFFEGTGAAPTFSATLGGFRAGGGCVDTDQNASDFTAAAPAPRNSATAPHSCVAGDAAPNVISTAPTNTQTDVPVNSDVTIAFSEDVSVSGDWYSIVCPTSGAHTATVTPLRADTYTLNPDTDFAPGEICSVTVFAALVSDTDAIDPPDNMAGDRTFSFTTAGSARTTLIHEVQGAADVSPKVGETVTVEGVVVGDFQAAGQFSGFYLQEEDADVDSDPATSEGIFVFSSSPVNAGDRVRLTAKVSEFGGLTELTPVSGGVAVTGTGAGASVTPAVVTLPVPALGDLERYEGMSAVFSQPLTVSEVFTLARFGEVVLSGAGRLYVPTSQVAPGTAANAVAAQNARSRILLDDGLNTQNPAFVAYPQGGLSASNTLRVGDTLPVLSGVVDFRFSEYRVQPTVPVEFTHTNPRPAAPDAVGGNLRIASFNVLNYFNGDGAGGGFPTARGANTPLEFQRQRQKEISALATMNADIVGLMEMENDAGPASAVADLVAGLNDRLGAGTYAYIDTGVLGTDEIKVALIYKPAAVTPAGGWKALTSEQDPRFDTTRNRPSLAQTFGDNATGRKLTVDVNHLKSKGSACEGDPDTGDGSGNCNLTRTRAAAALVDWLKTDPTASGDPDFLLIGDMNSYTFESPIQTFVDGGLTNLVRKYDGLAGYSYVFDGESGYLDHALATPSLEAQVSGVGHWHINADEPIALDYNTEFKSAAQVDAFYSPAAFRASDHDPVLIGIGLAPSPTANAGGPYTLAEGGSTTLTASGTGTGTGLSYAWDLDDNGTYETAGQTATFSAATIDGPATLQIRVRVSDGEVSAVSPATVQVTNVAPTATFAAPASVFVGFDIALALSSPVDPSAADRAAGFTYAFDCGGGAFVAAAGPTASCPTNDTGTRTVRGRITDKDGGSRIYQATVSLIVTAASLCDLATAYQPKDGVANSLCAKLAQGSYDAFSNEVAAQAGKSLTSEQAATLTRLVRRL
jgi:predicted extracellular nuclease